MTFTDPTQLRTVYKDPHPVVLRKDVGRIDAGARAFLADSPFVVVASVGADGCDASPRGGPPGFVTVLDEHRVAWGELAGNNRIDTLQNLVEQAEVGLLFFVPGVGETLRVNGRASVTDEATVLDACALDGRRPRVAVVVEVTQCYIHCAKALRRSSLWDPSTWKTEDERPEPAHILADQLGFDGELVRRDLEVGYAETMWEVGGDR